MSFVIYAPRRSDLRLDTHNGPIGVTIQGRVGRRIATTLGAGGAVVRAVTTNGPVGIRRN